MSATPKPGWDLTREALECLLARLHDERSQAALAYESLRSRLIAFFDWRGVRWPDNAADEVLDRVARRVLEGQEIPHIAAYAHGVARLVLLEQLRLQQREQQALIGSSLIRWPVVDPLADDERVASLGHCLQDLPAEGRALILAYYEGAGAAHLEERKALAVQLGVTYATLRTRAHRLRLRLEACLRERMRRGSAR